jgi:hypothetical protein
MMVRVAAAPATRDATLKREDGAAIPPRLEDGAAVEVCVPLMRDASETRAVQQADIDVNRSGKLVTNAVAHGGKCSRISVKRVGQSCSGTTNVMSAPPRVSDAARSYA